MVFRGKYMLFAVAALFIFSLATGNRIMKNYQNPANVTTGAAEGAGETLIFRNFELTIPTIGFFISSGVKPRALNKLLAGACCIPALALSLIIFYLLIYLRLFL